MHHLLPRLWFQHFSGTSWIAEDDSGQPLGFLVGFVSPDHPDEAYIHMVATSPNHRKQGVARALYERFFEDVRARGVRTRDGDHVAGQSRRRSAFHRAMGFVSDDGPGTQRLYGIPAFPDYDARRRRSNGVHPGRSDRVGRQLLVQQPAKPCHAAPLRGRPPATSRGVPRPRRTRRHTSARADAR